VRSLTVLEVGDDLGVSAAGRFLASLGARVICVEPPDGHAARRLDGVWPSLGAGKESVVLDLTDAQQVRWLARLAGRCDVIIDGLRDAQGPLVRTELKRCLGRGERRHVLMSVTPYGLTGAKSGWRSNSFIEYHAGGDAYFLPPGHSVDARAPVAGGDLSGECEVGWSLLGTALAFAYGLRRETGPRECVVHLDVSKQEVLLDLNRVELSRFANQGTRESRATKGYETGGLFYAMDGPVVIMPLENHQWLKLYELMGNPPWSREEAYATRPGRLESAADLQYRIQEWCVDFSAEDLYHRCQRAGVPAGIVKRPHDVFAWRQARQRGFFQPVASGAGTVVEIPWLPLPSARRHPAGVPALGEHSAAILIDELGLHGLAHVAAD
jgi:crotonobetainyl-CoA:carnitine CoA-transferase CaiB-like acyl-CoA transferase